LLKKSNFVTVKSDLLCLYFSGFLCQSWKSTWVL